MRVMVLIKANEQYEAGAMPSKERIAAMGKFNQEIIEAGVMSGGDSLKPIGIKLSVLVCNSRGFNILEPV